MPATKTRRRDLGPASRGPYVRSRPRKLAKRTGAVGKKRRVSEPTLRPSYPAIPHSYPTIPADEAGLSLRRWMPCSRTSRLSVSGLVPWSHPGSPPGFSS
jgi:hypothetical protein